jgi:hypothetical protein
MAASAVKVPFEGKVAGFWRHHRPRLPTGIRSCIRAALPQVPGAIDAAARDQRVGGDRLV